MADAKFLEGNLFRHVSVMSLTASLGLVAVFAVDLVDMLFISMLGQAELAAAVGYAGAILFFTTSFGIGMAIAAGALVARALGAGDEVAARRRASTALVWAVAFGAVFAGVVWMLLPLCAVCHGFGTARCRARRRLCPSGPMCRSACPLRRSAWPGLAKPCPWFRICHRSLPCW